MDEVIVPGIRRVCNYVSIVTAEEVYFRKLRLWFDPIIPERIPGLYEWMIHVVSDGSHCKVVRVCPGS